jgi:serine/threonine protein phosphatase PrpC
MAAVRPQTTARARSVLRTFFIEGEQMFPVGHADAIGRRPTMEDACSCQGLFAGPKTQYYGLFDGHGGKEVAMYCADNLHKIIAQNYVSGEPLGPVLKSAFASAHNAVVDRWLCAGSTAAVVVIADDIIYAANVGDSRIILIEKGKARRLSVDHKATLPAERRAILSRGGTVFQGRVGGILMLSRAIGDGEIARYLSHDPYMASVPLKEDMKLILACDGVWDVMSDQMAADIFVRVKNPTEAARSIKQEALKRGTMDNVSVICVDVSPGE